MSAAVCGRLKHGDERVAGDSLLWYLEARSNPQSPRGLPIDFHALPIGLNLLLFAASAIAVWRAGMRLAVGADMFAERTGIGRAAVGALLLGGVTSLPEAATTVAAARIGSPELAVNNLLGGVTMQIVTLALADARLSQYPLSQAVAGPVVLLQAVLLIVLLSVTAAGVLIGDADLLGLGVWTSAVFLCGVFAFMLLSKNGERRAWLPQHPAPSGQRTAGDDDRAAEPAGRSTGALLLGIGGWGVIILAGGIVLAQSADALAVQTGLGASLVGAVLLALATSLPELSTTISAIRIGQVTMAYSNIFGANMLDLALLVLADIAYRGGPVLNHVGDFALGLALLGILLTSVSLLGLLERRRRMLWRFGLDSVAILMLYVGGLAVLYHAAD